MTKKCQFGINNKIFAFMLTIVMVIIFYSPRFLGQETAKEPFGLELTFAPHYTVTYITFWFCKGIRHHYWSYYLYNNIKQKFLTCSVIQQCCLYKNCRNSKLNLNFSGPSAKKNSHYNNGLPRLLLKKRRFLLHFSQSCFFRCSETFSFYREKRKK